MRRQPAAVLVVVAGPAGAGKGRFASRLVERIRARRIDVSGDLEPYPSPREYEDAAAAARAAMTAGESVVIVGPFHTRDSRSALLHLAAETRSALLYVECSANESVRRRRLRTRVDAGADMEAWVGRLVSEDALFERTRGEIPRAAQMLVDTTVGIDIWAGLAASRVEAWFVGAMPSEAEAALSAG